MVLVAPTLQTDTTADKRLRVSSRERLEAADVRFLGSGLSDRVANFLRSIIDDRVPSTNNTAFVLRGFVTKQRVAGANMSVDVTSEAADNYSAAFQVGYLCKETVTSMNLVIDSEAVLTNRIDIILIRYVEDETDTAPRTQVTQPVVTLVQDEVVPPVTGVGDGTTKLFDLANRGVIPATVIAKVNGVPVAHSVVPALGANGVDQIVFADAPASGATIRVTYYWQSGGTEQNQSLLTRYTSDVEYRVEKGTANGVEPSLPAGWMKIAKVSGITTTTTTITDSMITKQRTFWYGLEDSSLSTAGGPLLSFWRTFGFMRNAFFNIIDMLAARTLHLRRTVNGTDIEAMLKVYRRGSSTAYPAVFTRDGHLLRNHKQIREDFSHASHDTAGSNMKERWNSNVTSGTTTFDTQSGDSSSSGRLLTGATSGNEARIRGWNGWDITAVANGSLGMDANESFFYGCWVLRTVSTTKFYLRFGLQTLSGQFVVGFERDPDGLGGITNFVANVVTTGPTNNRADTGVADDQKIHMFEIAQRSATVFEFYIDGVRTNTITQTPIATEVTPTTWLVTNEAVAKQINPKLIHAMMGPISNDI